MCVPKYYLSASLFGNALSSGGTKKNVKKHNTNACVMLWSLGITEVSTAWVHWVGDFSQFYQALLGVT